MTLTVNGEQHAYEEPLTVLALLERLGYEGSGVAVALNRAFVARSAYGETLINDRDEVEIVAPIQGG